MKHLRRKVLRWGEIALLIAGFACMAIFVGHRGYEWVYQSYEDYRFRQEVAGVKPSATGFVREKLGLDKRRPAPEPPPQADIRDPEPPRRQPLKRGELVGRVSIPRLGVSAIVHEGVDNRTLARAVGHVPSTARPGERGNMALAAHRDTHFRPVRNLKPGDVIQMETVDGTYEYKVAKMWVVSPKDVSVLKPTRENVLTLITCYPFNYVGHAPKRYIVRAIQVDSGTSGAVAGLRRTGERALAR